MDSAGKANNKSKVATALLQSMGKDLPFEWLLSLQKHAARELSELFCAFVSASHRLRSAT